MDSWKALLCCFVSISMIGVQATEFCAAIDLEEENLRKFAKANNHFAITFYKKLASESKGNLFFSPFSISSALGMLFYGAKGEAAQELRQVLGYAKANIEDDQVHSTLSSFIRDTLQKMDSNLYTLSTASALLVDKAGRLHPDYKTNLQKLYQAYVEEVDFANDKTIVNKVNAWVKQQTGGQIDSIFDSIDPSAAFLLLSGAYFKAKWRSTFDSRDTRPRNFLNNGLESQSKSVPMMHMVATLRYNDEFKCQALEMPYVGKNLSMVVFLPERGQHSPFEKSLSSPKLNAIRMGMLYHRVIVALPKFKLSFSREVSHVLESLGVTKVFESSSGYCGLSFPAHGQTEIRHKAALEVDEEGTKAAAMTGMIVTRMMPHSSQVPEFIADHPFVFAIFENKSGMILFMGRVLEF